jgi:SAM-dependent methyltransferase
VGATSSLMLSSLVRLPQAAPCTAAQALIARALSVSGSRAEALRRCYTLQTAAFLSAMEAEIQLAMLASGQSLSACLQDLGSFLARGDNATEAAACTSLHLNALLLGIERRRRQCTARQLAAWAPEPGRLLVAGPGGTGLAGLLLDAKPNWHGILVAPNAAASRFGQAYLGARGDHQRAACMVNDMTNLSAADASFDIVTATELPGPLGQAARSMAELTRVLRPGGLLAISLPIDWHIAEPTANRSQVGALLPLLAAQALELKASETVAFNPDTDVPPGQCPGFAGFFNAVFRKQAVETDRTAIERQCCWQN